MKKKSAFLLAAFIMSNLAPAQQAGASILYKKYLVANYGGVEILCEPYIVRKDDSVIKLLRDRGEISANDFPEFFRIFQSLNPRVADINLIRLNDEIIIPLKKLTRDSLPGQSTGVVTIPQVSLTSFGEMLEAHTEEYEVKEGDKATEIIDKVFHPSSPEDKNRGMDLFKKLNPDVSSPDQIKTGQKLVVPKASIKNQSWYKSLYGVKGGAVAATNAVSAPAIAAPPPIPESKAAPVVEKAPVIKKSPIPIHSPEPPPMEKFASLVGGTIYKTGEYYIPTPDGKAKKIDLRSNPMLEVEGGGKVLFCKNYDSMSQADRAAIKNALPDTSIIDADNTDSVADIVKSMSASSILRKPPAPIILNSENASIEIMPEWFYVPGRTKQDKKVFITEVAEESSKSHPFFLDYLKHARGVLLKEMSSLKKTGNEKNSDYFTDETQTVTFGTQVQFQANIAIALGYNYSRNVQHSVASADGKYIDITADTIYSTDGQAFIMIGKDMKGENIEALRASGFKIIESQAQNPQETDYSDNTVASFLVAIGCMTEINPTLRVLSTKEGDPYVTIKPTGILVRTPNNSDFMIVRGSFSSPVTAAIQQAGIKTVVLSYKSFY